MMEPLRLREFFRNNQIAIVQSFSDVQAHLPCISIQLANDGEDQGLAMTDDFGGIDGFSTTGPIGRDENTIHANTTINVGIHTKEQLLTKYLYHITKYFVLSAKEDLIRQNFIIATFKGSDFTRDASWQGDHVYTRFLNISGKTEDSWVNLDEVVAALDQIALNTLIAVPANNAAFNVPSSLIDKTVSAIDTQIQLANSFYIPESGTATLISSAPVFGTNSAGESILVNANNITTEEVIITGKNSMTNIVTVSRANPVAHPVIPANDPNVARNPITGDELPSSVTFIMGDMSDLEQTIQTTPSPVTITNNKVLDEDLIGILHRTIISGSKE